MLDYEQALTRVDSRTGLPTASPAHFLWIGERTRALGRRTRRVRVGRPQPGRREARPRRPRPTIVRGADRQAQPGQRAGTAHLHHPAGRCPDTGGAAAAGPGGRGARRAGRAGSATHARQHVRGAERPQDTAVRGRARRGPGILRGAPGPRHPSRRHPHRVHRGQRHRVRRRQPQSSSPRTCTAVRDAPATRGSTAARPWTWPSPWPRTTGGSRPATGPGCPRRPATRARAGPVTRGRGPSRLLPSPGAAACPTRRRRPA